MTELETPTGYRDSTGGKREYPIMDAAGDAYMLLSLKGAPVSNPSHSGAPASVPEFVVTSHGKTESQSPMAKLETKGFEYTIRAKRTIIGRDSSNFKVDVNMPLSTFISRKHIEILFEEPNSFFMICRGKNGVFVDGVFQRRNGPPYKLSPSCVFRFPSTSIRLEFRSLIVDRNANVPSESEELDKSLANPDKSLVASRHISNDGFDHSPNGSPTATISAANSCPSSPRTAANRARFEANLANKSQDDFKKGMAYAASNVTKEPIIGQEAVDLIKPALPIPMLTDPQIISATATPPPKKKKPRGESGKSAYRPMTHSGESSGIPTPFIIEPTDDANKPPYSYAQLIVQAIASSPEHQLTLNDIYSWIAKTYPFYRTADKGWQNSIRHNLSLNRYFLKVARCQSEPGKGSFWKIDPTCMEKLTEQSFKKRRQRPNCAAEGGTPVGGTPRFSGVGPRDSLNTSVISLDFSSEVDRAAASIGGQEMLESEIISADYSTQQDKPTDLCYGTVTNSSQPTGQSTFLVHAPGPFVSGHQIGHPQHGQLQQVTVTHPSGQTVKVLPNFLLSHKGVDTKIHMTPGGPRLAHFPHTAFIVDSSSLPKIARIDTGPQSSGGIPTISLANIVKPVNDGPPPTISLSGIHVKQEPVVTTTAMPTISLSGIVKQENSMPTISLASIVKPVTEAPAPMPTISLASIVKPVTEVAPPALKTVIAPTITAAVTVPVPTTTVAVTTVADTTEAADSATTAPVEDITIAPTPANSNVLDHFFKTD